MLIGPTEHIGQAWFGMAKYTGPWLLSSVFFAGAMINTAIRLRPDPLVASGGTTLAGVRTEHPKIATALRVVNANPKARLALASMVVSQSAMVAVMAMTPVHLKLHGHEGISQYVVSLHIAGMFAFSPLVGRVSDRQGRVPAILMGSVCLLGATVLAAVSGDVEQLLFPSLWLLGLGWNFGLIGGSSLLIESVPAKHRVSIQGSADLSMSLCGGIAGFGSGFVRRAMGFHRLANLATIGAGALLVAAFSAYRSERPARSPAVPAT